jgi:hypothetical protein
LSNCCGRIERSALIGGETVWGGSTISAQASTAYQAHRALKVRTDRLDNVYGGSAGFIKIDVEGHEQAVLDGAVETIDRCQPRVLVEVEERLSPSGLERIKAYFSRHSYCGHFVHNVRLEPVENFSLADMQNRSNTPDMTASLREHVRNYVNNFIFLPAGEPRDTLDRIRERLAKL